MKAFRYLTALGLGAAVSLGDATSPPPAQAQTADPAETTALVAANLVPETQPEAQLETQPELEVPDGEPSALSQVDAEAATEVAEQEAVAQEEEAIAIAVIEVEEPSQDSADSQNATLQNPELEVSQQATTELHTVAEAPETETTEIENSAVSASVAGLLTTTPVIELAQAIAPAEASEEAPEVTEIPVEVAEVEVEVAEVAETVEEATNEVAQAAEDSVPVEESADPIEQEFLGEPALVPEEKIQAGGAVESAPKGTSLIDTQPNLLRPVNADDVVVETAENITLEQAIEIARQNSPTIRIRQLEVERAEAAVDQAKAAFSPQLSTQSGLTQTGAGVRSQEIYDEVNDVADPNGNADTKTRTQTTTLAGNVRLDYNIIQPGRRSAIRAATKQKEQAELTLNQDLAQLRLDVSTDYYAVQEADEQVKISASAVESALKSLQDAQALERAGVGTRFAVLQAEVQLANEEQNRINAISSQNQTRRALAQRLSIPENFGVASADTVQAAGQWERSLEDSIILAYQNRVELDSQLLSREISEAQRESALAANRPSLGLFAQVGPQFSFQDQRVSDNDDSGANSRTGTRAEQLNYTVGLQFNWRFFDGGGTKASARQQELNKAIAEEQFENTRDGIRQQVENAFYSLQANFNNISTSKKGVQQAASALRLARLRFQAGVGTQTEVVDAERDLTTARGNEVSAILNYNRALVQMRRAVGETLVAPAYESPVYQEASN